MNLPNHAIPERKSLVKETINLFTERRRIAMERGSHV